MDFYETKEAYVLELAVPGLAPSDIDIDIEGRRLVVRAERAAAVSEGRRYWHKSLPRGIFARKFWLPASADAKAATASVENGMLTVSFPKTAEAQNVKIEVAAA